LQESADVLFYAGKETDIYLLRIKAVQNIAFIFLVSENESLTFLSATILSVYQGNTDYYGAK